MLMKTAEFGFLPTDIKVGSTVNTGEVDVNPIDRPFGFALHVLDMLRQQEQLATYMITGGFVADAFMADQLRELLNQHGYSELTTEQVWAMAADVMFNNLDEVPDDTRELDGETVPVAA